MVELKYASRRICQMDKVELLRHAKAILIRVKVITGWVLPTDQYLSILIDQFQKRLVENCGDLNPEEIEFAFRKYGTTIEDWGKELNLNLLDKVLLTYIDKRFDVSKSEEQIRGQVYKPEQKISSQEELDNFAREDVERQYQLFLRGRPLKGLEFNKSILEKDGLIKPEQSVIEFFKERATKISQNIYVNQPAKK